MLKKTIHKQLTSRLSVLKNRPKDISYLGWLMVNECIYLWPPYVIGQAIIFLPCAFFYLSIYLSIFLSSPNLSRRRLDACHTALRPHV